VLALWETRTGYEKRALLGGLDLHRVLSTLWALGELGIANIGILRLLLMSTTAIGVVSRGWMTTSDWHLGLSATLPHLFNKE
jgi:hypothetical protein